MGLVLGAHAMKLDDSYAACGPKAAAHAVWQSADRDALEKEKKDLEEKVEAVRKFLDSRILWTAYTARHLDPAAGQRGD